MPTNLSKAELATILSALDGQTRNPANRNKALAALERRASALDLTADAILEAAPGLLDGRLSPADWLAQITDADDAKVETLDDEHWATLVIRAEASEQAGSVARQFVAMMHLGYYPANHQREFPEVIRVEQASSYFDAAEPFAPVVESIEVVDDATVRECPAD